MKIRNGYRERQSLGLWEQWEEPWVACIQAGGAGRELERRRRRPGGRAWGRVPAGTLAGHPDQDTTVTCSPRGSAKAQQARGALWTGPSTACLGCSPRQSNSEAFSGGPSLYPLGPAAPSLRVCPAPLAATFLGLWVTLTVFLQLVPKPLTSACRQQEGTSASPGDLVQFPGHVCEGTVPTLVPEQVALTPGEG